MKFYTEKPVLTQQIVMRMLEAACEYANEKGIAVNIAISDDGGNLKGFIRMDGAPLLSTEISQNKSYTAAAFGIPTEDWYPLIKDEPSLLHGIVHTKRLTIFGGGLPIYIGKHLAGGIGVSGGTAQEDIQCAEHALAVLKHYLEAE